MRFVLDPDALALAGFRDERDQAALHLGGVLLGDHAAVEAEGDAVGHHVGVDAAGDQPDVELGRADAGRAALDARELLSLRVERREDRVRRFERIGAGLGHGRVGLAAAHGDFEMQAAIVRGHDRVGEAGADREIRLGDVLVEQPLGTDLAAGFLVVGEVQLDMAVEAVAVGLERAQARRRRSRSRISTPQRRGHRSRRPFRRRHRDRRSSPRPAAPRRRGR